MAAQAIEDLVIILIGVTIGTLVPFPGMLPGVYREILVVMIERGWHPGKLRMAQFAFGWILGCQVVRVAGLVVIVCMATIAGIRRSGVVPEVTQIAFPGDGNMGPLEYPVTVVDGESCRFPARIGGVTGLAGRG
jgi:hypothetical protein